MRRGSIRRRCFRIDEAEFCSRKKTKFWSRDGSRCSRCAGRVIIGPRFVPHFPPSWNVSAARTARTMAAQCAPDNSKLSPALPATSINSSSLQTRINNNYGSRTQTVVLFGDKNGAMFFRSRRRSRPEVRAGNSFALGLVDNFAHVLRHCKTSDIRYTHWSQTILFLTSDLVFNQRNFHWFSPLGLEKFSFISLILIMAVLTVLNGNSQIEKLHICIFQKFTSVNFFPKNSHFFWKISPPNVIQNLNAFGKYNRRVSVLLDKPKTPSRIVLLSETVSCALLLSPLVQPCCVLSFNLGRD